MHRMTLDKKVKGCLLGGVSANLKLSFLDLELNQDDTIWKSQIPWYQLNAVHWNLGVFFLRKWLSHSPLHIP